MYPTSLKAPNTNRRQALLRGTTSTIKEIQVPHPTASRKENSHTSTKRPTKKNNFYTVTNQEIRDVMRARNMMDGVIKGKGEKCASKAINDIMSKQAPHKKATKRKHQ